MFTVTITHRSESAPQPAPAPTAPVVPTVAPQPPRRPWIDPARSLGSLLISLASIYLAPVLPPLLERLTHR